MTHLLLLGAALRLVLASPGAAAQAPPGGVEVHVAPGGRDAGDGSAAAPFATLARAREAVRAMKKDKGRPDGAGGGGGGGGGGVTVTLHAGLYELHEIFALTAEDAGSADAPVVYRAAPGEEVRISGGRRVTTWTAVDDPAVLARLDPAARGKVVAADLRALGITDFGTIGGGFGLAGGPGLELFWNDEPMTLARYPNEGFIAITGAEGPTKTADGRGRVEGIITYEGDRPARWAHEKEPWALGYWFHDWAEGRQRIASIDADAKRLTLAEPHHHYGYRGGGWFYGFNLLCEIDRPGEWYLDRAAGKVYFWPPTPIEDGHATVSVLDSLVSLDGATHVTFRDLTFETARGDAVRVERADHNALIACTLRSIGGWAVRMSGTQSGVVGCEITGTGDGGISLHGGDRRTLTPAGLYAENNHIHHWSRWNRMNRHGIMLSGVGHRAAHNHLHDSPHTAIQFSGNDHVIELNEIHDVCLESNDAGAIYAGRDWTGRGTVIRHNFLHRLRGLRGKGCIGIYLDDMFSGTTIIGNVFHDVTSAAYIGGGHDNAIENNLFVDCSPAVHVDSRGLGWAHRWADDWLKEAREKGTLSGVRFKEPPYSERYPALATILDKDPAAPTGSVIARNVRIGGTWDEVDAKARPFVTFTDNITDGEPGWVEWREGRPRLRDDSPAMKAGFRPIPVVRIGLVDDGMRASKPVE